MSLAAIGRAPVKGTRWRWLDTARVDIGGVAGDRDWALVDDDLKCLKTVQHPGLMVLEAPTPDQLAAAAGGAGEVATVSYWGRGVRAELHDLPWCATASRTVGARLRLARATSRPGFIWNWPVSVLFTSELDRLGLSTSASCGGVSIGTAGLGGTADATTPTGRAGASDDIVAARRLATPDATALAGPTGDPGRHHLARYRPNLVIDDADAPLDVHAGTRLQVGGVTLVCRERIDRCAVVNHDPADVRRVDHVLQVLPDHRLGWGCEVLTAGDVSCGTSVTVG